MARRQIGQEVFTFVADPIAHRGSLDRLSGLIDWSLLDRHLSNIYAAAKGEPAWPPLALFRALLLAVWYDLSDVKLSEALEDRASFQRFCGFAAHEPTPERTAFVRFRRELVQRGLDKVLFNEVTRQLKGQAITIKTGTLVDATVIASASYRDEEAAWVGHKRRKAIYGFKAHVTADADTALVEELTIIPGNVNDGVLAPPSCRTILARFTPIAPTVEHHLPLPRRPKVDTHMLFRKACVAGLVAMPYASCGRGTITSSMCAAGSRRSLAPGCAATAYDVCAGQD